MLQATKETAHELPLGNYTNITSTPVITQETDKRLANFILQSAARDLLPGHRVGLCLRRVIPGKTSVDVKKSGERLRYTNLMRCSRLWVCPICSAQISEERRIALRSAIEKTKYEVGMLTYTLQHANNDRCSDLVETLSKCYSRMTSGREYQGFIKRYGILGSLRALEVTHGKNGYHPHLHVMILCKPGMILQRFELEALFRNRWNEITHSQGNDTNENGLDFSTSDSIAEYVGKIAGDDKPKTWGVPEELTKQPVKTARAKDGRTARALLVDYVNGDKKAGEIWREMVECLSGHKQLVPSRGLWELLGITGLSETVKEETTTETDTIMARIDLQSWRVICMHNKRGEVLQRLENGESISRIIMSIAIEAAERYHGA